jgi:hypothetical protein
MIGDLNGRVEAILSGDDTGALTVREGIQEENNSKLDGNQRKIPRNFSACLDVRAATKTSVRTPKDYPVLRERFA